MYLITFHKNTNDLRKHAACLFAYNFKKISVILSKRPYKVCVCVGGGVLSKKFVFLSFYLILSILEMGSEFFSMKLKILGPYCLPLNAQFSLKIEIKLSPKRVFWRHTVHLFLSIIVLLLKEAIRFYNFHESK